MHTTLMCGVNRTWCERLNSKPCYKGCDTLWVGGLNEVGVVMKQSVCIFHISALAVICYTVPKVVRYVLSLRTFVC